MRGDLAFFSNIVCDVVFPYEIRTRQLEKIPSLRASNKRGIDKSENQADESQSFLRAASGGLSVIAELRVQVHVYKFFCLT